jgi:tetratricopeptide (TPR) repeat protein
MSLKADIAECSYQVAEMQFRDREAHAARQSYEHLIPIWQELWHAAPNKSDYGFRLAQSLHRLGSLQLEQQRSSQARAHLESALKIHVILAEQERENARFDQHHSEVLVTMASIHRDEKRPLEALQLLDRADDLLTRLLSVNPQSETLHTRLARCKHHVAHVLFSVGRLSESRAQCQESLQILDAIAGRADVSTGTLRPAAEITFSSARLQRSLEEPDKAGQSFSRARVLYEQLLIRCPNDLSVMLDLSNVLRCWAALQSSCNELADARDLYLQSWQRLERLVAENPTSDDAKYYLAVASFGLAKLAEKQHDTEYAHQNYARALNVLGRMDVRHRHASRLAGSIERRLAKLNE